MTPGNGWAVLGSMLCLVSFGIGCGEPASEPGSSGPAFSVFAAGSGEEPSSDSDQSDPYGEDEQEAWDVSNDGPVATGSGAGGPPVIERLEVVRVDDPTGGSGSGERWRVVASVEGLDEEDVEFEYRWTLNGLELDDGEDSIAVDRLERGDALAVTVRAFDGVRFSAPASSGEMRIGNAPPTIDSRPPALAADGSFRYIVRASDADDSDPLRFALRKAPEGMSVGEEQGVVTWVPDIAQAGRHEVEIVVSDGNGGEASQSFVLSLVEQGQSPASPAATR